MNFEKLKPSNRHLIAFLLVALTVTLVYSGALTYAVMNPHQRNPLITFILRDGQQSFEVNVNAAFFQGGAVFPEQRLLTGGWVVTSQPQGVWYYNPSGEPHYLFRSINEVGGGAVSPTIDPALVSAGWNPTSQAPNGIWYSLSIHNVMTNCFANLAQKRLGSNSTNAPPFGNNGANYIALTGNATSNNQNDCSLQGEITANNLGRVQGTFTANQSAISAGDVTWQVSKSFAPSGGSTLVSKAGLTEVATGICAATVVYPNGCFRAVTLVSPAVTITSVDTLTLNWQITWTS